MILKVKDLIIDRGSFHLQLPELQVESGKVTALIGKSGSGKSSILLALAGFIPCKADVLTKDGKSLDHVLPEKREIAFVFQSNALFLTMTVAENIAFPLRVKGVSKSERSSEARRWARKLEIEHLLEKEASDLSGGEAQRVQLARAFASKFGILFLDEPFSSLDVPLKESLRRVLKQLVQEEKVACLLVTHDPQDIEALADTVVKIGVEMGRAGKIFQ